MSRPTQDTAILYRTYLYETFTLCGITFQLFPVHWYSNIAVLQPQLASQLVWALSCSLAATWEIDFSFSSYGYLDVSVPHVYLQLSYVFTQ